MSFAMDELSRRVAEEVNLDDDAEAREIVRTVAGTMRAYFPGEAWDIVERLLPPAAVDPPVSPPTERTIQTFFTDLDQSMGIGTAAASRYARVVAEAISVELSEEERQHLADVLDDDLLSLFEVGHRGELTEPDGHTRREEVT